MTTSLDRTSEPRHVGSIGDGWGEQTLSGTPVAVGRARGSSSATRTRVLPQEAAPEQVSSPEQVVADDCAPRRPRMRPPTRTGARRIPFAVLLLGVLAAGMCALLALNTATAASEVRERRLDAANATLNATQEQLSRSISGLQAPGQLARMAARLGMVPAGSPAYLRINPNGTVTVLGHPAAIVAPPKVIKLTPAQVAAQKAAQKAAAKTKAAQAKAAKAAQAKAAQAKAAKAAKPKGGTTTTSTTSPNASPTSPPTKTSPTKTSPTKTSPTKTSPTKTSPTKTSPTTTVSGGHR